MKTEKNNVFFCHSVLSFRKESCIAVFVIVWETLRRKIPDGMTKRNDKKIRFKFLQKIYLKQNVLKLKIQNKGFKDLETVG